jgi:hypothetical protein
MFLTNTIHKPSWIDLFIKSPWIQSIKYQFTHVHPPEKWRERLKEKNLLQQIEAAKSHGKLSIGITEVWDAAKHKKGKLLIGEKEYLFPEYPGKMSTDANKLSIVDNATIPLQDAVDEAIEQLLEEGGAIEFVGDGLLNKYQHLVMIQSD